MYCTMTLALQQTATNCNILQHTEPHCNTLQCTAPCDLYWNTLRQTATYCNTLYHTEPPCNTLQRTATYCNTLQRTATYCTMRRVRYFDKAPPGEMAPIEDRRTGLQYDATHCNILQHAATHYCVMLQPTATTSCYYTWTRQSPMKKRQLRVKS